MSIDITKLLKGPTISESDKTATRKKYEKYNDIDLTLAIAKKLNKQLELLEKLNTKKTKTPEVEEDEDLVIGKDTLEEKKHSNNSSYQDHDSKKTFKYTSPKEKIKSNQQHDEINEFFKKFTIPMNSKRNLEVDIKKTKKNNKKKNFIQLNKNNIREISEKRKNKTLKIKKNQKNKSKKIFAVRKLTPKI